MTQTFKSNGSILSEVIPIQNIGEDFIKMVLYGGNRVGKTTLACKFPKPLLLVAMDPTKTGGALSVKRIPGVDYLRVETSKRALQLAAELSEGSKYKTIVVDSVTSYQDIFLKEILDLPAIPEQLDWGKVSRDQYRDRASMTKEGLRPFLALDYHVIAIAKKRNHNRLEDGTLPRRTLSGQYDPTFEPFFAADLGEAVAGWLHDACDYICELDVVKETKNVARQIKIAGKIHNKNEEVFTGRNVRRLRTMLHPNYAGGFRSNTPEAVPEFIYEPTFEKIYAAIHGDVPK